jgi:L-fuconolactonase
VLPDDYKELAVPEGVTGTVVIEASFCLQDNQWILDLAKQDPYILGVVGNIIPNRDQFSEELERFSHNPLFKGIRCRNRYFEDVKRGSFLSDMEILAEKDLELDVIVQEKDLDGVLKLAEYVPELRIVVDHIAHMPIDGKPINPKWIEYYRRIAEFPLIFMKVSALMEQSIVQPAPVDVDFYRPTLDALLEVFGKDRLIYGSNWPVCERSGNFSNGINIVKVYFKEKGEEIFTKYFYKNALTAYKLNQTLK